MFGSSPRPTANHFLRNSAPLGLCRAEGMIKNVNTIEDFKNTDKNVMLKTAAQQVCHLPASMPEAGHIIYIYIYIYVRKC